MAGSTVFQNIPSNLVSLPAGTYNIGTYGNSGVTASQANVVIGAGPSPAPTPSYGGPSSVIQSFGKAASGICDEVASEDLNWAGVAPGGWSESWGLWEGYEGPVCTRTLVYSTSRGGWTVN